MTQIQTNIVFFLQEQRGLIDKGSKVSSASKKKFPRQLKGQQREMVFWPKLSRRIWKERSQKNLLFGPKVSELGPNLAHLTHQENAHIFIPRLLRRRTFSFYAFSCNANFHSPPSPTTLIFIPRLLLGRRLHRQNPSPSPLPSLVGGASTPPGLQKPNTAEEELNTYEYAYFHFPYSPRTLIYITRLLLMR